MMHFIIIIITVFCTIPAQAFSIPIKYVEPSVTQSGVPLNQTSNSLNGLQHTTVYYKIYDGKTTTPVQNFTVPGLPGGGVTVQTAIEVPDFEVCNKKALLTLWVTATNLANLEGAPSYQIVDKFGLRSPLCQTMPAPSTLLIP